MDLEKISEDMNIEEKKSLENYIKNGTPGISKITEVDIFKWFELYMSGKTYAEIATITKSKKDLILYISNKSGWNEKRLSHYKDLSDNLIEKIKTVKLKNTNTVASIINALGKYYGDKFDKFLSTNDNSIIEEMDTKMLAQYYKSMEVLDRIIAGASDSDKKSPTVNVNVGSGAEISQIDENTVEVTDSTAKNLLRSLAEYKKEQDRKNS